MSLFDIMDKQMTAAQDRWPDSITYDGDDFACTVVSLSKSETAQVNEMFSEGEVSKTVQVQKSRFTGAEPPVDPPGEDDLISHDGEELRVLTVFTSPHGLSLRFVLGPKYAR